MVEKIKLVFFKLVLFCCVLVEVLKFVVISFFKKERDVKKLGLLNIEFFHKEIGIYGGYGHIYKEVTDYLEANETNIEADVLLTRTMPYKEPLMKRLDNANVVIYPNPTKPTVKSILKYMKMINKRDYDAFVTMEYYSSYFY